MQQPLKQLGLRHLENALPLLLETARQEQWTYEQFLRRAIGAEIEGRDRRAVRDRTRARVDVTRPWRLRAQPGRSRVRRRAQVPQPSSISSARP